MSTPDQRRLIELSKAIALHRYREHEAAKLLADRRKDRQAAEREALALLAQLGAGQPSLPIFVAPEPTPHGEESPHVHTRECYDDPGPGHGPPATVCDVESAIDTDLESVLAAESEADAAGIDPEDLCEACGKVWTDCQCPDDVKNLAAMSDASPAPADDQVVDTSWRETPVSELWLEAAAVRTLAHLEIATLGELADYLAEDGFRELGRFDLGEFRLGHYNAHKVLAALELWWTEHGDGPPPFTDEGNCPADRERTALLIEWIVRQRMGDAEPAWGMWSEFVVTLEDGADVRVIYDPKVIGSPDPYVCHFSFFGPVTGTGFRSHYASETPRSIAGRSLVQYATDFARQLAAELAKSKAKTERKTAKAKADRKPKAPPIVATPGEDGLFVVAVGSTKPTYAVRAPSKLEALYFVGNRHGDKRVAVKADDGSVARLGLKIEEHLPRGYVGCNKCHAQRKAGSAPACTRCQCPEYHRSPLDTAAEAEAEVAKGKAKGKAVAR